MELRTCGLSMHPISSRMYILFPFIANLWKQDALSAEEHRKRYVTEYYGAENDTAQLSIMEDCIRDYPRAMLPFGEKEDEHAGEQFYNYVVRDFIYSWMKNGAAEPVEELFWCIHKDTFAAQMEWFTGKCLQTGKQLEGLYECGLTVGERIRKDSVLLQVKIHRNCLQGAILFTEAFATYERKEYKKAFFLLGNAAEAFEAADSAMRDREHGKWKDFYANDCLDGCEGDSLLPETPDGLYEKSGRRTGFLQVAERSDLL